MLKRSDAHLTTDDAGFDSNDREISASSVSWGRSSTGVATSRWLRMKNAHQSVSGQ